MASNDLGRVRMSLLRWRRPELGPDDGEEAFERHILLAIRFHRAAGLNQTRKGDGQGWGEFFEEHFPKRPEWRDGDAKLLWDNWRLGLVKIEAPLKDVTLTHGKPGKHWYREPDGALCIDLESMWADFEASVDSFMELLKADPDRAAEAVRRWRERIWTLRPLVEETAYRLHFSAESVSAVSAGSTDTTTIYPPDNKGS